MSAPLGSTGIARELPTLLSPEEVADHSGLSRRAIYRAIESGEIPATKLRSRWRLYPEDVEAWWARNRKTAPNRPARIQRLRALPAENGLRRLLSQRNDPRGPL